MTHNDLRYEFGPYQLNPSKRILTRDGEGIPLTPKATEILLVQVKHAGQLVDKDDFSQNIFTLRRALGDDRAGPKYIETIARRGYRLTGSVKTSVDDFAESVEHVLKLPLVVVLLFDNKTGDLELDYRADGLTHKVINNLPRLFVVTRYVSQRYLRYKASEHGPQHGRPLKGIGPLTAGGVPRISDDSKEWLMLIASEKYADEAALHFQPTPYKIEGVGHHGMGSYRVTWSCCSVSRD